MSKEKKKTKGKKTNKEGSTIFHNIMKASVTNVNKKTNKNEPKE